MKFLRNASVLIAFAIASGTAANAYTLDQAAKPAEYPPSSYKGDVYVDSRGCAYVRANIGSQVNWVPRLNRDRNTVVCGLTPTAKVAGIATGRPPAPPAPPPPAPVAVTTTAATAATTTATTTTIPVAPAPVAAASAAPKPAANTSISRTMTVTCPADGSSARVRIGSDTVAVQCAPSQTTPKSYIVRHANGERTRLIANPAPKPAAAQVAAVAAPVATVGARQAVSSSRVRIGGVAPGGATNNFGRGYGVGSGAGVAGSVPRATTTIVRNPSTPATGSYGQGYSIAPSPSVNRVVIPSGYRPAWEDDRLNPNRGPQTLGGDLQMASVWDTSKVPMVEANPPAPRGLIAQPEANIFTLFTKTPSTEPAAVAPRTPAKAAPAHRYVQVGMFNEPANAERAAAKLRALGLPGRVAKTQSGRTVVVAGPYDSAEALRAALSKARSGGFSDAFLRG